MKRHSPVGGFLHMYTSPDGEYVLYEDCMKAMDAVYTATIWQKFKKRISVSLGKCRCSGYGVYPDGVRCPGCSDCKKNCTDGMCGTCDNCKLDPYKLDS